MAEPEPGLGEYQRLVVADPTALENLLGQGGLRVLVSEETLHSYELFIVEQWACSRENPCAFIVTSNGNAAKPIRVQVLEIPRNPKAWPEILQQYMQVMLGAGSRARETSLGMLLVSNLSNFPSALSVIALPDSNTSAHTESFMVNENLKRLGCSGRTGFHLTPPTGATRSKFFQIYKMHPDLSIQTAAVEVIYACQTALAIFGCLDHVFVDGLFCDETERAINTWWQTLGFTIYNIEPGDGILGPTTIASLLGLLLGSRNRLQAIGSSVPKDALDYESLKRAISQFQKQQNLTRSRRLDLKTVKRLREVTHRAIAGDGGFVPRAVKSTVAELSGKGGEMVLDIMKSRDKRAIADVETSELETFMETLSGATCKWLWRGKTPKIALTHGKKFGQVQHSIPVESSTQEAISIHTGTHTTTKPLTGPRAPLDQGDLEEEDPQLHHSILRGVAGIVKGAVSIPYTRVGGRYRGLSVKVDTDSNDLVPRDKAMESAKLAARYNDAFHEHQIGDTNRQDPISQLDTPHGYEDPSKPSDIHHQQRSLQTNLHGHIERSASVAVYERLDRERNNPGSWIRTRNLQGARSRSTDTRNASQHDNLPTTVVMRRSFSTSSFGHQLQEEDQSDVQDIAQYSYGIALCQSDTVDRTHWELKPRIPVLSQLTRHRLELLHSQIQTLARVKHHLMQDTEMESSKFQTNVQSGTQLRSEAGSDLQETMIELDAVFAKFDYEVNSMQAQVEAAEAVLEDFERQLSDLERGVTDLHQHRYEKMSWTSQIFAVIERLSGI